MRTHEEGFSLVEIMVGLAIGMLAMIVVMQVFSQSEGQKRTTTGGADALSNAAVALTMIERDIRNAGWGMGADKISDCKKTFTSCNGSAACGGTAGEISDFPSGGVFITDGGTKPDGLSMMYFTNPNVAAFRIASNTVVTDNMADPSAEITVASTEGCQAGSLMLVSNDDHQCSLMQATDVDNVTKKIKHVGGSFNPADASAWPNYTQGAKLSCFTAASDGPQFKRSYAINSTLRQLLRSDNAPESAANNEVMTAEIVDLQAQYGVSSVASEGQAPSIASQSINQWVDATGTPWSKPALADRNRIKAVRIAIVARSAQYEKPLSGAQCATTTQAMADQWSTWAKFATASYPADWMCYRYKVIETIVPFRNTLWGGV
ncbi:PilW family protein [Pseudoduganella violaceinigra]|uniref:PilW family protein n=1 Tax=Pseudoduganella violaceinigra TaxID=246602 RepID=UPI0004072EB2|nr:PilW family protein [Pseudoduganella violaceinigra]